MTAKKSDPLTKLGLEAELVDIDRVHPYKGNAKIGDVSAIRESIRTNGIYRTIVVRRESGEILAGNHTWKAAKEEKLPKIWVNWVSCSALEARRINLADNKLPELGGYNEEALLDLLSGLPSLEGTGYQQADLDVLLTKLGTVDGHVPGPEDIPDDDYTSQHGVIVLVDDQEQQQEVYEALLAIAAGNPTFSGVRLKIVAV